MVSSPKSHRYSRASPSLSSDASAENLAVGLSLYRVRGLLKKYLNEPVKISRSQVLRELEAEEGAAAGLVAGLLAHMKPPWDPPEPYASMYDPDDMPDPIKELPFGKWLPKHARRYHRYAQYFQPDDPYKIKQVRAHYCG